MQNNRGTIFSRVLLMWQLRRSAAGFNLCHYISAVDRIRALERELKGRPLD